MNQHTHVLAAHGNGNVSPANHAIRTLASRLSARDGVDSAISAFNQGEPGLSDVINCIGPSKATVIPVMTSDGYFVKHKLIRGVCQVPGSTVQVTPPLGADPKLQASVIDRIIRVAHDRIGTVLIVGHGTNKHAASNGTTRKLTQAVARHLGTQRLPWKVRAAYLDQSPLLEQEARKITGSLIVVPWLIGGGEHEQKDILDRLGFDGSVPREEWFQTEERRVCILKSLLDSGTLLSSAERMTDLAANRFPLRLATRKSPLAIWQAHLVVEQLAKKGVPSVLVPLSSDGDRNIKAPITRAGLFTDDLTDALAQGEADLAVHSLKDLPLDTEDSLFDIQAVLARDAAEECLVSENGQDLCALPSGSVVGTSSARRAAQIRAIRPDLYTRPIRGTIESRVDQVIVGTYDATVLASAGLERLGMTDCITERFSIEQLTPEPGQGVIALQARRDDWFVRSLVSRVDHAHTRRAVETERSFARGIISRFGLASLPSAYATSSDNEIKLAVRVNDVLGFSPAYLVSGSSQGPVVADAIVQAALWIESGIER